MDTQNTIASGPTARELSQARSVCWWLRPSRECFSESCPSPEPQNLPTGGYSSRASIRFQVGIVHDGEACGILSRGQSRRAVPRHDRVALLVIDEFRLVAHFHNPTLAYQQHVASPQRWPRRPQLGSGHRLPSPCCNRACCTDVTVLLILKPGECYRSFDVMPGSTSLARRYPFCCASGMKRPQRRVPAKAR